MQAVEKFAARLHLFRAVRFARHRKPVRTYHLKTRRSMESFLAIYEDATKNIECTLFKHSLHLFSSKNRNIVLNTLVSLGQVGTINT